MSCMTFTGNGKLTFMGTEPGSKLCQKEMRKLVATKEGQGNGVELKTSSR